MNKKDIIHFFDMCASSWDENMIRNDDIINKILDNAGVIEGADVLDVACGTGVLFEDYLGRNVASLTGVDISPEMIKIAESKVSDPRVSVICGDIEKIDLEKKYDCCVVYNAFPHFPDPAGLISVLASYLKTGGYLTIAHGMSRECIDRHHSGNARKVSVGLMHENDLVELMRGSNLEISTVISDDKMYQVTGRNISADSK